jgi:hypothetical protein
MLVLVLRFRPNVVDLAIDNLPVFEKARSTNRAGLFAVWWAWAAENSSSHKPPWVKTPGSQQKPVETG